MYICKEKAQKEAESAASWCAWSKDTEASVHGRERRGKRGTPSKAKIWNIITNILRRVHIIKRNYRLKDVRPEKRKLCHTLRVWHNRQLKST